MGHHGKHKCCSVCGAFINVVKVSSAVMTDPEDVRVCVQLLTTR